MQRAVDAPGELLLRDEAEAAATTQSLLADGLSSDEAVRVALLNNPRVRAAMTSIGVSRAEFVQSTLFSNPSLFLSMRFPDGGGRPNVEANLAQNIAELWLMPARRRAARQDLNRVVLEAANSTASIVLDVRRAYVRSLAADEQARTAQQGVELTAAMVELAGLRKQAGSGSQVDVNLARVAEVQSRASLRQAEFAATNERSQLCRLLGVTTDPAAIVLIDALRAPTALDQFPDDLIAIARQARLDLRVMESSVASAEALARLERVRFLRSVDLGFSFELSERRRRGKRNWLAETVFDSMQSRALTAPNLLPREQVSTDTVAGPTLSLELPIWDQNQAQIARADRLLALERQRRDALLVDLAQDIHATVARVRAAIETAELFTDELVPTTDQGIAMSRDGYRVGSVPFLSLLEAQRAYVSARVGETDARRDAFLALIELERATGRPMDSPNPANTDAESRTDESPVESTDREQEP